MSSETKTIRSRSVKEGPDWHCGPHNYTTENIEEWQKHLTDVEHNEFGHKPCMICSTRVHYTDNIAGHNVVCDNCLDGVINFQVARKEREARKASQPEEASKSTVEQIKTQQEEHKPSGEVQISKPKGKGGSR